MARFEPDYRGIGEVLKDKRMAAAMVAAAEPGAAAFSLTAPKDTGEFASSVSVMPSREADRATAVVSFDAPYSAQLIFGGRHKKNDQAADAVHQCVNAIERG